MDSTNLEEIDSYMYQTVGQDAIDLVAQALDVPLYRRVIQGSAIEQSNEYGGREANPASEPLSSDETEDLYELLRTVVVRPLVLLRRRPTVTKSKELPSLIDESS